MKVTWYLKATYCHQRNHFKYYCCNKLERIRCKVNWTFQKPFRTQLSSSSHLSCIVFLPKRLQLKIEISKMILKKVNTLKLCHGTQLLVKKLFPTCHWNNCLNYSRQKKKDIFIFSIPIIPTDLPFELMQLQFLVRFSFTYLSTEYKDSLSKSHLTSTCFSNRELCVLQLDPQITFSY